MSHRKDQSWRTSWLFRITIKRIPILPTRSENSLRRNILKFFHIHCIIPTFCSFSAWKSHCASATLRLTNKLSRRCGIFLLHIRRKNSRWQERMDACANGAYFLKKINDYLWWLRWFRMKVKLFVILFFSSNTNIVQKLTGVNVTTLFKLLFTIFRYRPRMSPLSVQNKPYFYSSIVTSQEAHLNYYYYQFHPIIYNSSASYGTQRMYEQHNDRSWR